MENKDNLLSVIETLFRYKSLILKTCGAAVVGSIIVALLLPVFYKSTTVFYVASTDLANPDKMFGDGVTETRYYGTSEDIDRIMTIAEGGEVVSFLIKKFNLYEHYGIDSTGAMARYKIQEKFGKLYNVEKTKFDAIELSVEDEDKNMASEIANAARTKIENISTRLIKESQAQQLATFANSINESESSLKTIGDSLIALRSRYGIYDPETQGETISGLFAGAQLQQSKLEGKLEAYKKTKGTPRDSIRKVTAELSGTNAQLAALEKRLNLFNEGSSTVISLSDQHETARNQLSWDKERKKHIKAAFDATSPAIHLVEKAEPAVVKSRPIRGIIVIASALLSFLAVVLGILFYENYKEVDWRRITAGQPSGNGTSKKKIQA